MIIRPIELSELPRIYALEQKCHAFPWTLNIIRSCLELYEHYLWEQDGEIIAFSIQTYILDECHLLNFCVDPHFQNQGIGTKLLLYAIQRAQEKNASHMVLEVRCSNAPAIHLYEKLGFKAIGRRKNYYQVQNGREDAIMYALNLNA